MNIAQLCQREIVTVSDHASLREAAALMRDHHVGALVVTDAAELTRAVGVVTDRDFAIEVLARDLNPADLRIGQLSSKKVVVVPGSATVQEAVAAMENAGVRRLLVTDDEGGVIGFVSTDDLVEAMAAELGGLARALRSGIVRESAERPALEPMRPRPVFLPQGTPGMF